MSAGRAAVWRERVECDPLARFGADTGRRPAEGSGRVEERAGLILALVEETPDITLEELRTALAGRGLTVGYGTLWRFFARRRITRKK
ncbi:MAG: Transposase protein, partial [Microvirga sp.]|nr:Transposase protein [Microvirga sp.]